MLEHLTPLSNKGGHPMTRLAEIVSKISQAEGAIRDLESKLTIAILHQEEDEVIQRLLGDDSKDFNLDDFDPNLIRQDLYTARAYEGELRTCEGFWREVIQADKEANAKTMEMFKPASG